jgi:hypothetical protein
MLEDFNKLILVLFVYIILYSIIVYFKPELVFNNLRGCLRPFGVGYKNTTILPLWLISIILAILSYFIVLYIIHLKYNSIFIKV